MTNAIDTSELELPYRLQYQESRTDSGGIMACRTHAYLGGILRDLGGVAQEVGGVADHVHFLAALKATHCLADVLRDTKTGSSRWIHETMRIRSFAWQEGYGAVT
ncbi:MAG: transposase, partial [Acidobacteria bacterium]